MGLLVFTLTRQTGQVWWSYHYARTSRIALRVKYEAVNEVDYILTDHLVSTSLTYRAAVPFQGQVVRPLP